MNLFRIAFPTLKNGHRNIESGCSPDLILGWYLGFVFSRFGEDSPIYTIPYEPTEFTDEELIRWCDENDSKVSAGIYETVEKETHLKLVEDAVDFVHSTEKATGKPSKVVAARIRRVKTRKSLPEIYRSLVKAYPDACVFIFSTSVSGTWIGASPELLCSVVEDDGWHLSTMALAGTRPANTEGPWDAKNVDEQEMVTEFIVSSLNTLGIRPVKSPTITHRAGKIEHICTHIYAKLSDTIRNGSTPPLEPIIKSLSPTPALCGYPRRESLKFIRTHESFERDFYGGFIGTTTPFSADIYVNLRSGRVIRNGEEIILYAGGGITRDSDPEAEWEETERKLTTLLQYL